MSNTNDFEPSGLNNCNDGKRETDVLLTTLAKCQAIVSKNVELEKKLKMAEKALEFYSKPIFAFSPVYNLAEHHKLAEEILQQIKEKNND